MASQSAPLLTIAALFVTLMIGFRHEVGGDWFTYEEMYESFRYAGLGATLPRGDPAYSFLNWFGQQLGVGIWFVNVVCGAIFTWGLVQFAKRQPNPWLAILVGVPYLIIVVAMGYTRQGVAIGLILAGLASLDRKGILYFAAYVLIGTLFHKTAIVVIPLVALAATRNRIATFAILIALAAILYYFFLASDVDFLMTNYVQAGYSSQGAAIRVAMNIPPAILFLIFHKRFAISQSEIKLWKIFSVSTFACLFALLVLSSSTAVDRVALYLIPLQLFVLSRLPNAFPTRSGAPNPQLLVGVIAYSALIQFIWLTFAVHAEYWLPYNMIFFANPYSD